jgi:2-polyprenyl-3-methyl-5-hydroxy-6-metoxy-1,4-benzoquinol methylase
MDPVEMTCPACACRDTAFTHVETHRAKAQRDTVNYGIYACDACGTQFADPPKAAEPEWYVAIGEYYGWRWEFDELIEDLPLVSDGKSRLNLLEVGCGEGLLLERLAPRHSVQGLETNVKAARVGAQKGINIDPVTIEAFRSTYTGPALDVICFFHVIEHLEKPDAFLKDAAALLKADGSIVLSTPNPDRFWLGVQREVWDYPPHHLIRFSKQGLNILLARCGFKVIRQLDEPAPSNVQRTIRDWLYTRLSLPKVVKGLLKLPITYILSPLAHYYASRLAPNSTGGSLYIIAKSMKHEQ